MSNEFTNEFFERTHLELEKFANRLTKNNREKFARELVHDQYCNFARLELQVSEPPKIPNLVAPDFGSISPDEMLAIEKELKAWGKRYEAWCKRLNMWLTFVSLTDKKRISYVKKCMQNEFTTKIRRENRYQMWSDEYDQPEEVGSRSIDLSHEDLKNLKDDLLPSEHLFVTIVLECEGKVMRWWQNNKPGTSYYQTLVQFKEGKRQIIRRFECQFY